jgi:hypothetical protein
VGAADAAIEVEIMVGDRVDEILPELVDIDLIHGFPPRKCGAWAPRRIRAWKIS